MSISISCQSIGKQVSTESGPLTILSDVSLTLPASKTLAIVGASGSGKSTLLGIMAGLDSPTSGKVLIGDRDITQMGEEERALLRANTVGFVFQSFQLLPSLTALQNVMLPLELQGDRKAKASASKWLDRVGLSPRLSHFPKQLSGGEQQRVAIARAFVSEPALLFADEPTGNLDSKTGQTISDLLFDLNHHQKTTLVLVTHDQQLAGRCHNSVTIDAGAIAT